MSAVSGPARLTRLIALLMGAGLTASLPVVAQASGVLTIVARFPTEAAPGCHPTGALTLLPDGRLVGIYEGDTGTFQVSADGTQVSAFLNEPGTIAFTAAADGSLWGVSKQGGEFGRGEIYRYSPSGDRTSIHSFSADSALPSNGLAETPKGWMYGVVGQSDGWTGSHIYRVNPKGKYEVVKKLSDKTGYDVKSKLITDEKGNVWGTAFTAGPLSEGTLFLVKDGGFRILHSFGWHETWNEGYGPVGELMRNSLDGRLYGVTHYGGHNSIGVIYSIEPGGADYLKIDEAKQRTAHSFLGGFTEYKGALYITSGTYFAYLSDYSGAQVIDKGYYADQNGENSVGELRVGADGRLWGVSHQGGTKKGETGCGTVNAYKR